MHRYEQNISFLLIFYAVFVFFYPVFTTPGITYYQAALYLSSVRDETRCNILLRMRCAQTCDLVKMPWIHGQTLSRIPWALG